MKGHGTVVVLDCHLRSQEGVLKNLSQAGYFIIGLSPDVSCPAFSSRYINKKISSPRLEDSTSEYVVFLLSLPERGILLYSNDLSALTVSRHEKKLRDAGFSFIVPKLPTLERAFDKWSCCEVAEKASVKAPKSILVNSLGEAESAFSQLRKPVILKSTRLAGGNYIKLYKLSELESAWRKMAALNEENAEHEAQVILQEWLEYGITDMWSCESVYSQDAKPSGFYSIQRIRSSLDRATGSYTSRLFAGEYQSNPKLEEITKRLLDSIQWTGFAHVEYMYMADEDEYYLAEINPRLPGYSYFPHACGFEMAVDYCRFVEGEQFSAKQDFQPAVYFEALRYPGDLSEGLYQIAKGRLKAGTFFKSYSKLFSLKSMKVVDPIRISDPLFSIKSLWNDLCNLSFYYFAWFKRKLKH